MANSPILFYVLDNLEEAGIHEAAIVISPETGEAIQEAVSQSNYWNMRFHYVLQETPSGLAYAVKVARPLLEADPFVMYLGDNLIGSRIRALRDTFETSKADASILLKKPTTRRILASH